MSEERTYQWSGLWGAVKAGWNDDTPASKAEEVTPEDVANHVGTGTDATEGALDRSIEKQGDASGWKGAGSHLSRSFGWAASALGGLIGFNDKYGEERQRGGSHLDALREGIRGVVLEVDNGAVSGFGIAVESVGVV